MTRWILPQAAKRLHKVISKMNTLMCLLGGLDMRTAQQFCETVRPFPHDGLYLSRMDWLKFTLTIAESWCNILRNAIKKMETQSNEPDQRPEEQVPMGDPQQQLRDNV